MFLDFCKSIINLKGSWLLTFDSFQWYVESQVKLCVCVTTQNKIWKQNHPSVFMLIYLWGIRYLVHFCI